MDGHKTLSEVYSGIRLDMTVDDLAKAADIIDLWLEGEPVDPHLLRYMAMMFTSMTNAFPLEDDEVESH